MSRITKLVLLTIAGVCVFLPLAMRGHGRVAAFLFIGWIAMTVAIFLRMKPVPADLAPLRKAGQIKSIRRLRRAGYFYVVALVLGLCVTDYRNGNLPWWPTVVGLAVSVCFIWLFFRTAKRLEGISPDEWERRFGK